MKQYKDNSMIQVAVVGSGAMGSGIAQVCIQSGYLVTLYDINRSQLELSSAKILKKIKTWAEKNNRQDEIPVLMDRLILGSHLEDLKDADVVIEAIAERLDLKQVLFEQLENTVSSKAILASNTSGISITEIARGCKLPQRVIGTHFFNPAPVMPLVEIIQGDQTSEETIGRAIRFIESLGKNAVLSKDVPGFIVNRIITPMLNEAMLSFEKGIATKEDIDMALKKGMNHPMGPLELSDYIGLDTLLFFMDHVYVETGNEAYKPSELLRKMVEKGHLGMKSGKGFYDYGQVNAKAIG